MKFISEEYTRKICKALSLRKFQALSKYRRIIEEIDNNSKNK